MQPENAFDYTEPLAAAIRVLLYLEWDPVGVKRLDRGWKDEYDSYAASIHRLAADGKTPDDIAAYLNFIESGYMSMEPRKAVNRAVAEMVFKLAESARS